MDDLYDKKIKCPVCDMQFSSKRVRRSKLRIEKRDSDLFTYYKGENPVKYGVYVCPMCGYAATEEKYSKVNDEERSVIREKVTTKWKEREFSGVRSVDESIICYKLALYCGEVLSFKKLYLGNICLRLAWLFRIKNDDDNEKKFLDFALKLFDEAYMQESIAGSSLDEITLTYLLAELNRRLGNRDKAISWFSQVVSHPMIDTKPNIKKLAREQWNLVRQR